MKALALIVLLNWLFVVLAVPTALVIDEMNGRNYRGLLRPLALLVFLLGVISAASGVFMTPALAIAVMVS